MILMEKRYVLEMNEKQLCLVNEALEEWMRIRMNQWWDLADSLAMKNLDLSPDNPNHKKIFDGFIEKRDEVRVALESVGEKLWKGVDNRKTEEQVIVEDMWRVIRHAIWKERENHTMWTVDADEPMQWSDEPMIKCEPANNGNK